MRMTSETRTTRGLAAYVVFVLLLASLFSYLDRHILSLTVPAIKAYLHITDTQVSLLQGFAFAAFYGTVSIPMGWAADRMNRRNLIIGGIVAWSMATIACGLATSYEQLLVARMVVGIGEAALIPAAFSIIADLYEPNRRGRALGVFSIGLFAGAGLAFIVGGAILNQFRDVPSITLPIFGELLVWKAAFVIVGAPGLLVALLLLTIPEPVRVNAAKAKDDLNDSMIGYFRTHLGALFCIWGAYTLLSVVSFGMGAWSATMLVRKFGLAMGDAGFAIGLSSLIGGIAGCLIGGWLGDRWTRTQAFGGKFRLTLVWWLGSLPALIGFVLIDNVAIASVFYGAYFMMNAIGYVSASAVIQDIVPSSMRGRASAVWLLLTGVLGQGFGPMAVALTTDKIFANEAALPWSLLTVGVPLALGGILLSSLGLRHYEQARREVDIIEGRAAPATA
ncbi:MFS transporter [Sphingomonas sp. AOB5]|uniref:spinster family MFS transporter n=1 Tax=Sphingomonas sp. AOB5 TaxID=3034017 RepID=UPI0023F7C940|nr:MFS transporter [Sphingomonas sp. AOB5]MDF7776400.1 MFS transporter [Sphingomonas sp. AOB5]